MRRKRILLFAIIVISCLLAIFYKMNTAKTDVMEEEQGKCAVVYFSATGNTRKVAHMMAQSIYTPIFEIKPEVPYTEEDLNWRDSLSRSSVEMRDSTMRPAIMDDLPDFSEYDLIYLGYPIWWGVAPRIINTFIESQNLDSLQIVLFCTSGGSPAEPSLEALRRTYPNLRFDEAILLNNVAEDGLVETEMPDSSDASL